MGISPVSCYEVALTHQAVNLSPIHKDLFDRLIIATAVIYQAKLASVDGLFLQYPELDEQLMKRFI